MTTLTKNKAITKIFYEIADLLDLLGDVSRPRAYRDAASSIEVLSKDLEEIAAKGDLETIPGVDKAIARDIQEFLKTGKVGLLLDLREQVDMHTRYNLYKS